MKKIAVVLITLIIALTATLPAFAQNSAIPDSWETKASMHQARCGLGVIAVNGKIYAIGGTMANPSFIKDVVGTNEEYDPAKNGWVYKASMPTSRAYFAIAAYQNKIYCIGGVTGEKLVDERSGSYTTIDSNAVEVYDTLTDTWTTKASMPFNGGMFISAQEINGRIYVIGNQNIHVYDPINDSWTDVTDKFLPRYSAVANGKIVATGVHDVGYPSNNPYYGGTYPAQQILVYDPQTNSIIQGKDSQIGVDATGVGATIGIYAPQRVYVMGVKSQATPESSINQAYDPKADIWVTATAMPTLREDFGVASINDTLYAIGGLLISYSYDVTGKYIQSSQATPTDITEQYIPLGYDVNLTGSSNPSNKSTSSNTENPALSVPELLFWIIPMALIATVCTLIILLKRKKVILTK